jgi:hypothetical protein
MHDVRLGKSDLRVSAVAFGTWSFGGEWGSVDRAAAVQTVDRALELGINFFDTAQGYGFGVAERLLADALWPRANREDVVVATKGGLRRDGDRLLRDDSAAWLRQGVDDSLRNLGTDYIDLYQIHWPDLHTPAAETGEALAGLVETGKIRHVGVSNYSAEQMDELSHFVAVETDQAPYHLFRRDIEENVLPYCEHEDTGVIVYGALAHGLLTGTMNGGTTFAADDWRSKSSDFNGQTFTANLAVVDRLKAFAADRGISLPQLAIAWTLANPAVDVALVGARHPDHLDKSVAAADVKLADDDLAAITRIVADGMPVRGPSPEGM